MCVGAFICIRIINNVTYIYLLLFDAIIYQCKYIKIIIMNNNNVYIYKYISIPSKVPSKVGRYLNNNIWYHWIIESVYMILLCKYIKYTNGRMYIYMVQKFSPAPYQSPRLSPVRLTRGWLDKRATTSMASVRRIFGRWLVRGRSASGKRTVISCTISCNFCVARNWR